MATIDTQPGDQRACSAIESHGEEPDCRALIDELLLERLPDWCRQPAFQALLIRFLFPLLKRNEAAQWVEKLRSQSASAILDAMCDAMLLKLKVDGVEHVPKTGPVMIVANHPTGMVDALAVFQSVRNVRPDLCIFSNRDAIRLAPNLSDMIVPVEWMRTRRSPERMRETLTACRQAVRKQRAILTFPAGGIARLSSGRLRDLDWLPATVKLAKKYRLPMVPLHMSARNSPIYYILEAFSDQVRDLVRFKEIFSKQKSRYFLSYGPPISTWTLGGDAASITRRLQTIVESGALTFPDQVASNPRPTG